MLTLPDATARHVRSLRLQVGDALVLFGPDIEAQATAAFSSAPASVSALPDPTLGWEYPAMLRTCTRQAIVVQLGEAYSVRRESALRIGLVQALSAAERMDYTVQKAVELGVHHLRVVQSAYGAYRLDTARMAARLARWRGIVQSASEQCGRTRLMAVFPPPEAKDWLAVLAAEPADLKLLLSPEAGIPFGALQAPETACAPISTVQVLIGPEGGFSPAEEAAARTWGYTPLRLGPRVLRTESVAPVIAALLQARYGDWM